jgi:hypothetical protein
VRDVKDLQLFKKWFGPKQVRASTEQCCQSCFWFSLFLPFFALVFWLLLVEEVQPVIERERRQTEIRRTIVPSTERVGEETSVEHRTAPVIEKPVSHLPGATEATAV